MAKGVALPWRLTLGMVCCIWVSSLTAALNLECYQHTDKALSVHAGGDFVDPYFANRALITAQQLGMEIQPLAQDWIAWSLAHQLPDGRFARYCLKGEHTWQRCAQADADDAMLALWQELLYRVSPQQAQHGPWQNSVQRAQQQLADLYDRAHGIYLVSQTQRYGLLMDNVEIYAALRSISHQQHVLGATITAKATAEQADKLQRAINQVFWRDKWQAYAAATNDEEHRSFYPYLVAQVYPWLFGMPTPIDTQRAYQRWRTRHAEAWLSFQQDKYPWGLVAAAADKLGDSATAVRWVKHATKLRQTDRWNILEEAIFQALAEKYAIPFKVDCRRAHS